MSHPTGTPLYPAQLWACAMSDHFPDAGNMANALKTSVFGYHPETDFGIKIRSQ